MEVNMHQDERDRYRDERYEDREYRRRGNPENQRHYMENPRRRDRERHRDYGYEPERRAYWEAPYNRSSEYFPRRRGRFESGVYKDTGEKLRGSRDVQRYNERFPSQQSSYPSDFDREEGYGRGVPDYDREREMSRREREQFPTEAYNRPPEYERQERPYYGPDEGRDYSSEPYETPDRYERERYGYRRDYEDIGSGSERYGYARYYPEEERRERAWEREPLWRERSARREDERPARRRSPAQYGAGIDRERERERERGEDRYRGTAGGSGYRTYDERRRERPARRRSPKEGEEPYPEGEYRVKRETEPGWVEGRGRDEEWEREKERRNYY